MKSTLPEPFNQIRRCIGRRSHPEDWPRAYDFWDAYDEEGNFICSLHYKGLNQLLEQGAFDHSIRLEFEDDPDRERTITIYEHAMFTVSIRLWIAEDHYLDDPDIILSKAEMVEILSRASMENSNDPSNDPSRSL